MNRYVQTPVKDFTKSIPYYETVVLSNIPEESVPFYYTPRFSERLDNISNLFYKTPNNWWIIAKANNLANGTIAVSGGTKLFIPNV
jgi:hypothetical protein